MTDDGDELRRYLIALPVKVAEVEGRLDGKRQAIQSLQSDKVADRARADALELRVAALERREAWLLGSFATMSALVALGGVIAAFLAVG